MARESLVTVNAIGVTVQGILEKSQSTASAEAECLMGHSSVKAA